MPGLSGISDSDPWASSFADLAFGELEQCLGAYPVDFSGSWTPPEYWDADDMSLEMPEHPKLQKSMVMLVWSVAVLSCRFLGVMQTVQRAEFSGAVVAMQAYWPCHLGIDTLNVARTVGRLLDKDCLVKAYEH